MLNSQKPATNLIIRSSRVMKYYNVTTETTIYGWARHNNYVFCT